MWPVATTSFSSTTTPTLPNRYSKHWSRRLGDKQNGGVLYIGLIATPKKAITHLLHGRISLTMAVLKGIMHGMATRLH